MRVRILWVGMGRFLAAALFALAAAAATAAGSGVVVAPHVDPPGTPLFHTHVFAAYRLPIFLQVPRARYDPRQGLLSRESLFDLGSTLVLALGALLWPRLGRPTLRAVAELDLPRLLPAQWRGPGLRAPPRPSLGS